MRLRIIAGSLGGRYIRAPSGRRTRPTSERVREAWFAALGPRVPGSRVLDLFAGSGALGIEALSRGAARATFVESDGRTAALLRENLRQLGLEGRSDVVRRDVFAFLRREGRGTFDLALADPPYGSTAARRLAEAFAEDPFAGLLCLEHPPGSLESLPGVVWHRRYGDTALSFLAPAVAGERGGGPPGGAPGGGPDEAEDAGAQGGAGAQGAHGRGGGIGA